MVSEIKERGNSVYYCSNCMMRQFQLQSHCQFCGNSFSNYESMLIKEAHEKEKDKVFENESHST